MRLLRFSLLFISLIALSNCTIYRSPDRKEFESDSSTFRAQNLVAQGCSTQSARPQADASRLITIVQPATSTESQFLWEYRIHNESVFESDNLKGVYCVFENR